MSLPILIALVSLNQMKSKFFLAVEMKSKFLPYISNGTNSRSSIAHHKFISNMKMAKAAKKIIISC